jgi:hypothetical protein
MRGSSLFSSFNLLICQYQYAFHCTQCTMNASRPARTLYAIYQKSATLVYAAGLNLCLTTLHKYNGKLETATINPTLYTNDTVSTNDMSDTSALLLALLHIKRATQLTKVSGQH